jgi:hypothetical protein
VAPKIFNAGQIVKPYFAGAAAAPLRVKPSWTTRFRLPFRTYKPIEKQNFALGISAAMFDPAPLLHGTRTDHIAP